MDTQKLTRQEEIDQELYVHIFTVSARLVDVF